MSSAATIHAATRIRSSGGDRDRALDSLIESGATLEEANKMVDDIDRQLGWDGRTLPDDVSPTVRSEVDQHRKAKREAAAAEAAASQPIVESQPTDPGLAGARPRFVIPTPETLAANADVSPDKPELTPAEKSRLKAIAVHRARSAQSRKRVADWLVEQGMSQEEATTAAAAAWQQAVARRRQLDTAQRGGDQAMAWLEIVGGIALLIGGLAAGWFVGLFVFIIIDGFRRLGSS